MSDVVFQSGTVLKQDVTTFIRNAFINAGWQQVSTDLVNDGYIFYSTGEGGNKKIYIRMTATGTNRFDTSPTGYYIDFWALKDYVPNPSGSGRGTMTMALMNPTSAAMAYVTSSNLTFNTAAQYFIHTNKDRLILVLEWPPLVGGSSFMVYLGSPTNFYPENQGQSNTILASSSSGGSANRMYLQSDNSNILNSAQIMNWYFTLPNTNPDRDGKYYFSELYFGNGVEGYRGKIEDIYFLPTANLIWKDEIVVESQTYRIIVPTPLGSTWVNSFPPSTYMAIRIA